MGKPASKTPGQGDPYSFYRLALHPIRKDAGRSPVVSLLLQNGLSRFFEKLEKTGLNQVWRQYLEPLDLPHDFAPWLESLQNHARLTAAHQLLQNEEIRAFSKRLKAENIDYFVFKGADLRTSIYEDPTLRPISDIDLFVHETGKAKAIELFEQNGYQLVVNRENNSHEVSLLNSNVCFDLHWALFRPGRTRNDLSSWLFDHRKDHHDIAGLDATANTLVMLIHPAITKYLLSPVSILIHQVDLAMLLHRNDVDWNELERVLKWSGMTTTAWSSLYTLRHLTGIEAPDNFQKRIEPGTLHALYLRTWIDRAWVSRWFHKRWLVAGFFSLALQDSIGDVIHALRVRSKIA